MAVIIAADRTVINACEATTNFLALGTWGAGVAASNDVYREGSNAINGRLSSATPGTPSVGYQLSTTAAGLDLTGGAHVFVWLKCFSIPSLDTRIHGGLRISISADTTPTLSGASTTVRAGPTNSKTWFVSGSDYDPDSGWICYVVDPNGTPDLTLGTATMSSVDRVGIGGNAVQTVGGGSVKPQPVIWDNIQYGTKLTVTCSAGSVATFQDIYAADTSTTNAYGILTKSNGIFYGAGKLVFGTTGQTAVTTFTDTNQVLVWQDFPVAASFYELNLAGAGSFATTVTLGSYAGSIPSKGCTIRGAGLDTRRLIAPVLVAGGTGYTANDILTISGGTGTAATIKVLSVTGGAVTTYQMESGGSYTSPPTGTLSVTGGTGSSATFTCTIAGGSIWTLTASAANQTLNIYGGSYSEMKSAALASTTVVRGATFANFGDITANGALFDGCTFLDLRTTSPISAVYAVKVQTTTATVTNCRFINCATAVLWDRAADTDTKLDGTTFISGGTGHAIELGSNTPTTITLTDVTFTGYGGTPGSNPTASSGSTDAAIYNNSGKTITINVVGGTTPAIRNGAGAATVVVADTVTLTITALDVDTGSPIQNARVLCLAAAGGDLPADETVTITRSGGTATVAHVGHGLSTGNQVRIMDANEVDYNGIFTITVTGVDAYTYAVSNSPSSPATGTIKSSAVLISALTNASGVASDTRTYSSNQPVTGSVKRGGTTAPYKSAPIVGTVISTVGADITVSMIPDV